MPDWNEDMIDLIEYAQDNLTNAKNAVGDEGCAVLEGLTGARRRIQQAIEHYFEDEQHGRTYDGPESPIGFGRTEARPAR